MNTWFSREVVYPIIFRSRGEAVFKHLKAYEAAQWLDSETVTKRQLARLKALWAYVETLDSPLSKKISGYGDQVSTISKHSDLLGLPIMEKQDLRDHLDWLHSTSVRYGPHDIRMTGGSTGDPCLVLADRQVSARSLAARILCQGWFGVNLGDRQIRHWGRPLERQHRKALFKDFILNRICVDSLALEPQKISGTFARIKGFGAEYIYGYTSLIQLLADNSTKEDIERVFKELKVVIATSETLLPEQRIELERHLGVPVALEYGCSEVDIISFSCPEGGQHVVAENILVEVIRFGDEPDGFGQVVVTDLNNKLMPVIRYRIGDLVPMEAPTCTCGRGWPCLGQVIGRSQGQYIVTPNGVRVHSQFVVYIIEGLMAEGYIHGRFQIIQEKPDQMRLKFSRRGASRLSSAKIAAIFKRECGDVLGKTMNWQVEYVASSEFEVGRVNKFKHFQGLVEK